MCKWPIAPRMQRSAKARYRKYIPYMWGLRTWSGSDIELMPQIFHGHCNCMWKFNSVSDFHPMSLMVRKNVNGYKYALPCQCTWVYDDPGNQVHLSMFWGILFLCRKSKKKTAKEKNSNKLVQMLVPTISFPGCYIEYDRSTPGDRTYLQL